MTGIDALAALAALGPLTFLAGFAVGWAHRDQQDRLGRNHREHRR